MRNISLAPFTNNALGLILSVVEKVNLTGNRAKKQGRGEIGINGYAPWTLMRSN
jgi:hypothetical protein